ncbi:uncharacterized protein LOC133984406 [Scomber scombrus]|uniref:uncharacterized protein LOC133984406 n=1 Tax=Scomber scombrus TaxID=13677 RepID=UPI002DD814B1|nr:uncharacterized protein LOC133984406 [Scomber scombrus]
MMKLILSLTLIWTLSSTAEALQCWQGLGDETLTLRPCASTQLCATIVEQVIRNGNLINTTRWSCLPSSDFSEGNHTFSLNVGFRAMSTSLHVCNTDGCNKQAIPYPDIQKNNLQCLTCDDRSSPVCNKTVQCVGVQDRCINGTMEDRGNTAFNTLGCVSSNLCEDVSKLEFFLSAKFLQPPKCCEGSICSSAWSVRLNVMTLLFGLITLIFY